jgi:Putative restriction endonuclease
VTACRHYDTLPPMNERFTLPPQRPTTQAADGLPRWCWTVAEVERLATAGFFTEYDQFELLGGEIVPMSPAGGRHETIRIELANRMARLAQEDLMVAQVPQFNLSPDTFVKPDILVHSDAIQTYDLRTRTRCWSSRLPRQASAMISRPNCRFMLHTVCENIG